MAINRVFAGLATADCPAALACYERSSPTPLSVPEGSLPIPSPRPQRSGRNKQLGVTMTTDDARGLTLTRTFDARRQLVWDAYTVPELLARWWGPSIMHTRWRRSQGEFNWSSQRLIEEGCDGPASGLDEGADGQGADEVAGEAVAASGC